MEDAELIGKIDKYERMRFNAELGGIPEIIEKIENFKFMLNKAELNKITNHILKNRIIFKKEMLEYYLSSSGFDYFLIHLYPQITEMQVMIIFHLMKINELDCDKFIELVLSQKDKSHNKYLKIYNASLIDTLEQGKPLNIELFL